MLRTIYSKLYNLGCVSSLLMSSLLLIGIVFAFVFAIYFTILNAAPTVTTLSCQRVEITQVNCQKYKSALFGLLKHPSTSFEQITAAKLAFDSVILVTKQGEFTIFKSGYMDDGDEIMSLNDQINIFINSNDLSLTLKQDLSNNWVYTVLIGVVLNLLIGVLALIIYFVLNNLFS